MGSSACNFGPSNSFHIVALRLWRQRRRVWRKRVLSRLWKLNKVRNLDFHVNEVKLQPCVSIRFSEVEHEKLSIVWFPSCLEKMKYSRYLRMLQAGDETTLRLRIEDGYNKFSPSLSHLKLIIDMKTKDRASPTIRDNWWARSVAPETKYDQSKRHVNLSCRHPSNTNANTGWLSSRRDSTPSRMLPLSTLHN